MHGMHLWHRIHGVCEIYTESSTWKELQTTKANSEMKSASAEIKFKPQSS